MTHRHFSLGRRGRRFLALALAACMLCAALPQVLAANPEVDAGAVYCFQSAEFHTGASDDLTGICITGVPQSALGTVRLGSRIICPGDILTAGQLDTMTFHPTAAGGQEAQLTYLPIYGNRVEQEAVLTISIRSKENQPPVAESSSFETYKNLEATGTLKAKDPEHFAARQYAKYKLAAGKTAKSILVSCGARLAPFDIAELRDVTAYDELALDTLGDRKTALFLIMSDMDSTFNFLISMVYTQLFNLLCEAADDVYGGRLPVHVRCLIDEAANIGQIPNLEKLMATIRSREISACLVLQAQSQLKALYKDNADTIIGNCDSRLFLGGSEPSTLKELSQSLGKETIDTYNTGESRGRETSHSLNYQKLGRELMSVDDLATLDGGKCILQVRGLRPFLSDKYDITKHPNYKYLSDADPKNTFDVEKYMSRRLKLKADEEYDVYEIDETNDET